MHSQQTGLPEIPESSLPPNAPNRRPQDPPTGRDRRQHRRFELPKLSCRVGRYRGTVLDVSLVGLAVETEESLRIGDRVPLVIELPNGPLEIEADVVRSRLVQVREKGLERPPVYHAGLDFRHEIDHRAPELLSFIEGQILLRDPDVRGYLRTEQRGTLGRVESCDVELFGNSRAVVSTSWSAPVGTDLGLTLRRGSETLAATARIVATAPDDSGGHRMDLEIDPLGCAARLTLRSWIRDELA